MLVRLFWVPLAFAGALGLTGCGGQVSEDPALDPREGPRSDTGGAPTGGTGGQGTGGLVIVGTGGMLDDIDCPDQDPEPDLACDPLNPYEGCPAYTGCYAYAYFTENGACGTAEYGTQCEPAGSGSQGDFCGNNGGWCAPGHMCVVGAATGARCAQICKVDGVSGCPAGLVCGATDVKGFGVCF